jgi:hypothetical protein
VFIKITFVVEESETYVKINFYLTGSVVIQGVYCAIFKDKYFKDLTRTAETMKTAQTAESKQSDP